jgi:LysM repeat protein
MKVSRVVLIVVALHVLVIGGIFIFEGCSRAKTSAVETAEIQSSPGDENLPAVPATDPAATASLTPPTPAPAPVAIAPAARSYTVKKGDSLWKVAKTEGVSIGDIARANNLSKTTALKVGQKLQVPAKAAPVTAQASVVPTSAGETIAPAAAAATPMEGNVYIVKTGDSLWKIARAQNVSVASLKQANSLTSDSLKIGQKLHVPTASAATEKTATMAQAGIATASTSDWKEPGTYTENGQTTHIVDFGESPASIAKKYGIKTEDLMKANNIADAKRIVVGQKLVIPTQPTTATTPAPAASITPPAAAPIVSAKN